MISNEMKVSGFFWEEFQQLGSYSGAAYLEGNVLYTNTDKLLSDPTAPQLCSDSKVGKC